MNRVGEPWREVEIELTGDGSFPNPYTDVHAWSVFRHEGGTVVQRPAFWDGGLTWRVRFASPGPVGRWTWECFSEPEVAGLAGQTGSVEVAEPPQAPDDPFRRHGFWTILAGRRNLQYADGTPALMAADTAWALPWRATHEQCRIYARRRSEQGFNAALLMSVQPDMDARGPRSRSEHDGFDVGFDDLPDGHISRLRPEYFRYLDGLADILVEHGIAPVWQPVFHGYGWKGLRVAGPVIPAEEYARYCRYLLARYGARPAMWLVGGDADGLAPGVEAGGRMLEFWDDYDQPIGIHYAPHQDPWAHQSARWLDFQWCQTGHNGEHTPQRVATMWERRPVRAIANGEPTYENIGAMGRAAGWWQGHEAWLNLTSGGTMGVVYGAGSLWQWRLDPSEKHEAWCCAEGAGWREALDFEGANYIGIVRRILDGLPFAEMRPDYRHTYGRQGLIVPGKMLLVYLPAGGRLDLARTDDVPPRYSVLDPRGGGSAGASPSRGSGEVLSAGTGHGPIETPTGAPAVVVFA